MSGAFTYVDGVGNVTVINGMAHIDLIAIHPPATEGQPPQLRTSQHLVMALPQFVRLCIDMAAHLKRMEEKGLISRKEPEKPA